ncbi:MAG TPA: hypothetical protein EYQ70_02010 [Marine Group III euryarchaeote]|uniref:HEAT repeat domain-containing protein n=1 Tax=Marine Group III euryarchaeote TaxID=2173149 RepID=A0A7J4GRC7_9ARCH|nr:hypothetical protein [Marine Group III euryarchaeote]
MSVNGELLMTTVATAKIIKLAGNANPPSLVALYGSTLGERKTAMSDLQNDLFSAGLSIIDFNARRYLSENDLSQPLVQQIVTELKSNTDTTGATADLVNRINESSAAAISTHLTSENRIELIHQFDSSMKKLSAISLQKKPLVILVQGMERAPTGAFMAISDFIANYLNIHKFMFIVSVGEDLLKNELNSSNTNMSPDEFLEDIFSSVVTFDETAPTTPEPEPIPELNNDDLFTPPVGLEVESGTDIIAKRKGGRIVPKNTGKPKSRIFKVRELSGKKTIIKKGRDAPRKIIKKAPIAMSKKFKAIGKKKNNFNQFMDPILKADVFSVKKFWGKVSSLAYKEFTQLVNMILKETTNRDSRIRATAITALASIAKGVSWEMPPDVMDRALILTSDGSNEVKDAAAEAIREMNEAGVEKTPQFTPTLETKKTKNNNSMELSELDADSMLGTGSNSIGSLSIESGSGGVKVMGGETAGISSAPTFEMSKDIPSFNEEKKPAQFKAVSDKPTKFKAVDDKTPKFKPSGKKKAEFKVVK